MSSFTDNKEREATVDFVDYFSAGETLFVPAGNPKGVTGPDLTLCGLTIAVEKGTTEEKEIPDLSKACTTAGKPAITALSTDDQNAANLALTSGRAQVGSADSPISDYAVKQSNGALVLAGKSYEVAPYGIAIPEDRRHARQGDPGGSCRDDRRRQLQDDPRQVGRRRRRHHRGDDQRRDELTRTCRTTTRRCRDGPRTFGPSLSGIPAVGRRHSVLAVLAAMFVHMLLTNKNLNWPVVHKYLFSHIVLRGVWMTIKLTILSMAIGIVLGIIAAVMRLSPNPVVSSVAWLYVWFFRGTPLLVQIIFWFAISQFIKAVSLGVPFGPHFWSEDTNSLISLFTSALLALSLNEGAYMSEIVRAGILSVDEGQTEAAAALGMRRLQVMRRVVLPQAMRVIVPPTGNEINSMLKSTVARQHGRHLRVVALGPGHLQRQLQDHPAAHRRRVVVPAAHLGPPSRPVLHRAPLRPRIKSNDQPDAAADAHGSRSRRQAWRRSTDDAL